MGARGARPVVLDAGALIAFERNDRKVRTLIELGLASGAALHAPSGVVGQVWRDGRRQVRLARLLGSGLVTVHSLDFAEAQGAGVICGATGTSDVIDASVVILARRQGACIVTSDPTHIRAIDPHVEVVTC